MGRINTRPNLYALDNARTPSKLEYRHLWRCGNTVKNVRAMITKALNKYPSYLLGETVKFTPFEGSSKNKVIQNTNCVVSIGSFQNPIHFEAVTYQGAHLTEIGLWRATPGKKPEDLIQSISGSIYDTAYTILGLESTAKGVGNFFIVHGNRLSR